jgi:3-phenylpropionate/trans-cinnamate dioxygenase ferredoxin reductase subunit
MERDQRTFVIVGASLAGVTAAETLRAEGFTGRIVLVGEERELPYERPPLSKGYLLGNDPRERALLHDEEWYAAHNVELFLDCRATNLHPGTRTVTLDNVTELRYDKLLLATGSWVRDLRVPGSAARGVHHLRTLDDADALRAALSEGVRVVVIGAGWIGLETAAAARAYGCPVTVVEVAPLPLWRVLGDEVAVVFRDLHAAHGVVFRFDTAVSAIRSRDGRATGVLLDDGTELAADVVVVGVGVLPATELAEAAGLAMHDGVVTDGSLRTSDPDIYACGDVASSFHPLLGKRIRMEHWANALGGGAAAARAMLGRSVVYDPVPYFYSDQYDLGMEYSGYVEPGGYDQVVFRGDPSFADGRVPEFIAFWLKDGRVLAGMNVNVWDVVDDIQRLVRAGYAGRSVDPAKLADPAVPLDDLAG